MLKKILLPMVLLGILSGCNEGDKNTQAKRPEPANVDQDVYCRAEIESLFAPPACKPGQKIAFLPQRFGNEQLPILFAANNCDLRYSIALTNGGVVCIYRPARAEEATNDQASDAKSENQR